MRWQWRGACTVVYGDVWQTDAELVDEWRSSQMAPVLSQSCLLCLSLDAASTAVAVRSKLSKQRCKWLPEDS